MGSGKSTVGKRLGSLLQLKYIDLDKVIEQDTGLSITDIFQKKGERFFRDTESRLLKEYSKERTLISLGGGTPCTAENLKFINESGISIYLELSSQMLYSRLKNSKINRPLIAELNDAELKHFIKSKLEERERFYRQADLIVDAKNFNADKFQEVHKEIVSYIK